MTYAPGSKRSTYVRVGVSAGLEGRSVLPVFMETFEPGIDQFIAPGISLPMGGAIQNLVMVVRRGRTRTAPCLAPGSLCPLLGFEPAVTQDRRRVRLDPRVLVVPVRVTVLADGSGVVPFPVFSWADPFFAAKVFERLQVDSRATPVDSREQSYVSTRADRLTLPDSIPDDIFTQCDVQFHMESHTILAQKAGREEQLVNSCVCGAIGDQIRPLFDGETSQNAIDVVVGGTISGDSCGSVSSFGLEGITCGPSNNGSGGCGRADRAGLDHSASVVLLNGNATSRNLVAHELGHMMGLRHVSDRTEASCFTAEHPLDTAAVENNLMFLSGGGENPALTAGQCARVRCVAANWLRFFGRMTAAEVDAVCSE